MESRKETTGKFTAMVTGTLPNTYLINHREICVGMWKPVEFSKKDWDTAIMSMPLPSERAPIKKD